MCVSPYCHSEVTLAVDGKVCVCGGAPQTLGSWFGVGVGGRLLVKTGRCTIKGSRVYASHHGGGRTTRVFIAIDESTAHGT